MPGFHDRVDLSYELTHGGPAQALFTARVVDRGLPYVSAASWPTSSRSLDAIGETLHRSTGEGAEHVLAERDGTLVQVDLFSGWVHARVAGDDSESVAATLAEVKELLPAPDPNSTHRVGVQFWTYGQHGPIPSYREISVPEWVDLAANYTAPVRASLERLMHGFQPAHGGQLILWHGEAGTGKTFALRALAWEWRDWCEFHYIVDPDSFFGEHADYLMSVLTQPGYAEMPDPRFMRYTAMPGGFMPVGESEDGEGSKAWRLLVLEDTGELLTPDAKAVIGQGLSRFLNVVDGLIGQGLRVLVLVTTNEPIKTLHPAVARPGRCAANIEFDPLTAEEAGAWLRQHGSEESADGPLPLAELYARLEGRDVDALPPAGFAG
ncbi:MAG TPA: DUF5925 domain-containing protein [Gaiellaceae bacterium]|nr:DUF5925 domain-containing protein [Gaiellaceae bacterium]